jgi:hypothetical protein
MCPIKLVGLYWTRKHYSTNAEFEFLTSVTVKNTVIWFVTSCSSVRVWRLVGTYCLHHQGRRVSQASWVSSETSGSLQTTRLCNLEDQTLHTLIDLSTAFCLPLLGFCLVTLRSWRWKWHVPSKRLAFSELQPRGLYSLQCIDSWISHVTDAKCSQKTDCFSCPPRDLNPPCLSEYDIVNEYLNVHKSSTLYLKRYNIGNKTYPH